MRKSVPTVFLDTVILKRAIDTQVVYVPEEQKINWGGRDIAVKVHRPAYENQNVRLRQNNPELFEDTLRLREVAALARSRRIRLIYTQAVEMELLQLPRAHSASGRFYGAPLTKVTEPVALTWALGVGVPRDFVFQQLSSIEDARFIEIQHATGALQGQGRPLRENQLMDAYHLWCAERAGADYLLTHDKKLINCVANSKMPWLTPRLVGASELVTALVKHRRLWALYLGIHRLKQRRTGRDLRVLYQDAWDDYMRGESARRGDLP